jgi:RES domain-containing protein
VTGCDPARNRGAFTGVVYRAHNPRWAADPLSGGGAARYGGRFNPVGVPALYTSLSVEGAWREAQQGLPFKGQPCTIVAYRVAHHAVIDLTRPDLAAAVESCLRCAWRLDLHQGRDPPSWQLARTLIAAECGGAIVPSVAPGSRPEDRNLVFWRWNIDGHDTVSVIDDLGRLPRDGASWGDP